MRTVTQILEAEGVQVVYSSPYTRAMQTVAEFAMRKGVPIRPDSAFRERVFADPGTVVEDPLAVMERGFQCPDRLRNAALLPSRAS